MTNILDTLKDLVPYFLTSLGTLLILKNDWIKSKFIKKEKILEVTLTQENIDSLSLDNVQKEIGIYRDIVSDLKTEIDELRAFIEEQKVFIAKQSKSLDYYEKKYGRITDN